MDSKKQNFRRIGQTEFRTSGRASYSTINVLDSIGEAILTWFDFNNEVRGYTECRFLSDFRSAALVAVFYITFLSFLVML